MNDIIKLFSNITGGPMTTIIGAIFFALGGVTIWQTYKLDHSIAWASVEVGLLIIGAYLLFKSDNWLKSLFKKDGQRDDSES